MILLGDRRYICRVDYKQFNKPTSNVKVYKEPNEKAVRRAIEEEFNKDGKVLINIKSIRLLNDD